MRKTRWLFCISLGLALSLLCGAGCDVLQEQVGDPNSALNMTAEILEAAGPVVTTVGPAVAAATPWGGIALVVANILTVAGAVYKNHKKNLIIDKQDDEFANVSAVTKYIVDVVETLPDETKAEVKGLVGDKLKNNDFYNIGKAIITSLKS